MLTIPQYAAFAKSASQTTNGTRLFFCVLARFVALRYHGRLHHVKSLNRRDRGLHGYRKRSRVSCLYQMRRALAARSSKLRNAPYRTCVIGRAIALMRFYPPQPAVSMPLLNRSSVAPSFTIAWPVIVDGLTW